MSKKKLVIDIDKAIDIHNSIDKENPINRKDLAEMIGKKYQDLVNMKAGRTPNFLVVLNNILSVTGAKYEDIVKEQKDE